MIAVDKVQLLGMDEAELLAFVADTLGESRFRAKQIDFSQPESLP